MPLLASLLSGLFAGAVSFFMKWFSKKIAFGAAAVATFGALTVAFYGGLSLLLTGIAVSLPSWPGVSVGMYFAAPVNLPVCIAACISADTAVALYRWNVENLKILSYIT